MVSIEENISGNFYSSSSIDYGKYRDKDPLSKHVELATVLHLVGDITDKNVCDIGTGNGFLPTVFRSMTRGEVVGLDASPEMIADANMRKQDKNVRFIVADCRKPLPLTPIFDVVTMLYVAVHSKTEEELRGFARSAFDILK